MSSITPVVMAGGSGTRLWPLSRALYPKQFLKLGESETLLQQVFRRLEGLQLSDSLVICNEDHRFLAAEQLREMGALNHNILLEPEGKNTAPAVALAAFTALKSDPDAVLLVLASDHMVQNKEAFQKVVKQALPLAQRGELVTFGIVPSHPETGYGYIRQGASIEGGGYKVDRFVEKPKADVAERYLAEGDYLWNSGMFVFRASTYLEELKRQRPAIYEACKAASSTENPDMDFIRVNAQAFSECPDESIDYAVMEGAASTAVLPLDAGWSDIGSWSALWEVTQQDEHGNAKIGDVVGLNTENSYLYAETGLLATVGLKDVVVVQTKDAVLVADKNRIQDVKRIVTTLKTDDRSECRLHREVYRPWGKYDSIDNGDRYQVKRITVKPGEKLSVQMHHHRAEHWIVVSGTANVTIDDETRLLTENQSVYIPVGSVHALENPGKIPLELIEVQSGAYLGEDDIVRFEDRYGRN